MRFYQFSVSIDFEEDLARKREKRNDDERRKEQGSEKSNKRVANDQ